MLITVEDKTLWLRRVSRATSFLLQYRREQDERYERAWRKERGTWPARWLFRTKPEQKPPHSWYYPCDAFESEFAQLDLLRKALGATGASEIQLGDADLRAIGKSVFWTPETP